MKSNSSHPNIFEGKFGRWIIYSIPVIILILGSFIHYSRGYYGAGLATIHASGVDDAYISYRYGWNLAHFGNLSWNESGYRSTEGFTNPLWVLASVAWSLPGNKEWVYPLSVLTSVSLSAMLLFLLTRMVYIRNDKAWVAVLGLVMVAAMPAMWLHTTSGLESTVFGLGLAFLGYKVIFPSEDEQSPIQLIIFTVLLGLLRSDGFIYLSTIVIAGFIAGSKSWKYIAIGVLIASIGLFSWRYINYAAFLPNTAVAKVNFSLFERIQGGFSFILFAVINSGLLIVLIMGIGGLRLTSPNQALAGLFLVLTWLGYYLYIGGDWGFERHLIGIYFLCAAFSAPLWLVARPKTRALFIVVFIAAIFISILRFGTRFDYLTPKFNDPWIMLAQAIREEREDYGVLVTGAAGKIPFFAGGECIDSVGLNDPYLSSLQRESFIPGHSSGSDQTAIEIASTHPLGVYSVYTSFDLELLNKPEDISLWVDNRNPGDTVNRMVTLEQWDAAVELDDPLIWSIITEPVQVLK